MTTEKPAKLVIRILAILASMMGFLEVFLMIKNINKR